MTDADQYHVRRELARKVSETMAAALERAAAPCHPKLRQMQRAVAIARLQALWDATAGLIPRDLMDELAEAIDTLKASE